MIEMSIKVKQLAPGPTFTYDFKKKVFSIEDIENEQVRLSDANGNVLAWGIDPKEFMLIMQSLINRNTYEYFKNRRKKGKKYD